MAWDDKFANRVIVCRWHMASDMGFVLTGVRKEEVSTPTSTARLP